MTWQRVGEWREYMRLDAQAHAQDDVLRSAGRDMLIGVLRYWELNRYDIRRLMKTYDAERRRLGKLDANKG